jgi:hypothetical protein
MRSWPGACTHRRAGFARSRSDVAVANTTGVSNTTVASGDSDAVTTAATTKTSARLKGAAAATAAARDRQVVAPFALKARREHSARP